jgi:hypothetical protein
VSIIKGTAERILSSVPQEKGFHFYLGLGMPTGTNALSLTDFGSKLKSVDARSLEFHTHRGDFENWVYMLGDTELVKSLVKLRGTSASGEKLRAELVRIVQTRVRALQRLAGKK